MSPIGFFVLVVGLAMLAAFYLGARWGAKEALQRLRKDRRDRDES